VQPQGQVAGAGGGLAPQQQAGTSQLGGQLGASSGGTSTGAVGTTPGGSPVTGTGGGDVAGPAAVGAGSGQSAVSGAPVTSREPIEVGFVTTSTSNAQALGINPGQTYSDKTMYDALVQDYNAHGGLAGHKIIPVYATTDTASSNWASQFAAACSTLTEDHHVKVVIGYVFVFMPSFEACLAKAGVPHLSAAYQPGDVVDQQQFKLLVATAHPTVDGFNLTALQGALTSGLLNKSTKLGLLVDNCADGIRAYTRSTEPWLKQHGINYQTVQMDCAQGASDVSGAASAVSSAELRFASSGVNLVYAAGVALLVFMEDAESQQYRPQYLTAVGGAALEANAPAAQMKNLHGFGWMPSIDVNPQQQPYAKTAKQSTCLSRLTKRGLQPSAYNDFMGAYVTCDGLDLYAAALTQVPPTAAQDVVRAVTASMRTFAGAATYNGALVAANHQHGGPAVYREYGWASSCSCMQYRGATHPIPLP
jgi:ABC-type branched-subunit amino acid transport system substrate-binding protein